MISSGPRRKNKNTLTGSFKTDKVGAYCIWLYRCFGFYIRTFELQLFQHVNHDWHQPELSLWHACLKILTLLISRIISISSLPDLNTVLRLCPCNVYAGYSASPIAERCSSLCIRNLEKGKSGLMISSCPIISVAWMTAYIVGSFFICYDALL